MKNGKFTSFALLAIAAIVIIVVAVSGCTTQQAMTPTNRTITDMTGRTVTIPVNVTRVATVGSVPAINSCLLAMGEGGYIVNGLDTSYKSRCKYEIVFSPNLENQTSTSNTQPDVEVILGLKPDVVITTDNGTAGRLEQSGIPVVFMAFSGQGNQSADRIKGDLYLVGEVFNDTARANRTIRYFDNKIAQVNATVSSVPEGQRPRVLYANMKTMSAPYISSEWCIAQAGGIPVSADGRIANSVQFDKEQLLKWNPDVLIVLSPDDVSLVYNTTDYREINAVKNRRVYVTPSCMGYFGGSSPEMAIAIEWMASKFYPDKFPESQTNSDIRDFYKEFYGYALSDDQLKEILGGLQ